MQLTDEQEQALLGFSCPESAATIHKTAIEQLLAMHILYREQSGRLRLTIQGMGVYLDLVRSKEF